MKYYSTYLLLVASSSVFSAATSRIYDAFHFPDLENRQAADCSDLQAPRSASCWDQLKISDYLTSWTANTPTCTGKDDAKCCQPNEPWSTCFLRLAKGQAGFDCTNIIGNACSDSSVATSQLSPEIVVQVSYVVATLVAVNNMLSGYYDAWMSAYETGRYTSLYTILYHDVLVNNGNIRKAIGVSLPFWGTPSVTAGGPQENTDTTEFYSLAQAFAMSVQQTPSISSALVGAPYDKKDFTYSNVTSLDVMDVFPSIAAVLSHVMKDVSAFNSFAAHGAYSGPQSSYWSGDHGDLIAALTTYMVGEALSQNKFSASPLATITKEAFQANRNCTSTGNICKDSSSIVYYRSPITQRQYQMRGEGTWVSLESPTAPAEIQNLVGEATTFGLMKYIEGSAAYMSVLFDGSYKCTLEGKAGGASVNVNADGSLDIACLSALPIYLAKNAPCPEGAVHVGGKCPFGHNS